MKSDRNVQSTRNIQGGRESYNSRDCSRWTSVHPPCTLNLSFIYPGYLLDEQVYKSVHPIPSPRHPILSPICVENQLFPALESSTTSGSCERERKTGNNLTFSSTCFYVLRILQYANESRGVISRCERGDGPKPNQNNDNSLACYNGTHAAFFVVCACARRYPLDGNE